MTEKKNVVILGAGVAGLAMGYFLCRSGQYHVILLEESPIVGGMCASFTYNGFVLDHGAHKLYSVIPGRLEEICELMGDRLIKLPKKNRIYLQGHLLDYPLRLTNLLRVLGGATFLKIGLGYMVSFWRGLWDKRPARSYEEYMTRLFGRPAYELIFKPLAEKVWGDPSQLHPDIAKTRVPTSNGLDIIFRLLGLRDETKETNAEFFYYPRRGFGDWPQKLKEEVQATGGAIITSARISELKREDGRIKSVKAIVEGRECSFPCDFLISSIPLTTLNRLVCTNGFLNQRYEADQLQFRHLILVYIFVNRPLVLKDQWIFFPEKEFIFSRIFEQKQMNPALGPKDQTVLCCDFTCREEDEIWHTEDATLVQRCIQGLERAGFIDPSEVIGHLVKRQRNFYPCYDRSYKEKIQAVNAQLKQVDNLLLTGRLGMYNYNNSDHCFDMAKFISEHLNRGSLPRDVWSQLEERVQSYRIVD